MSTAVQPWMKPVSYDTDSLKISEPKVRTTTTVDQVSVTDNGWTTQPVHGNSKRLCQINRNREECGTRATLVTTSSVKKRQTKGNNLGVLPIYHCEDPRHVANAHKQVTEFNKQ